MLQQIGNKVISIASGSQGAGNSHITATTASPLVQSTPNRKSAAIRAISVFVSAGYTITGGRVLEGTSLRTLLNEHNQSVLTLPSKDGSYIGVTAGSSAPAGAFSLQPTLSDGVTNFSARITLMGFNWNFAATNTAWTPIELEYVSFQGANTTLPVRNQLVINVDPNSPATNVAQGSRMTGSLWIAGMTVVNNTGMLVNTQAQGPTGLPKIDVNSATFGAGTNYNAVFAGPTAIGLKDVIAALATAHRGDTAAYDAYVARMAHE